MAEGGAAGYGKGAPASVALASHPCTGGREGGRSSRSSMLALPPPIIRCTCLPHDAPQRVRVEGDLGRGVVEEPRGDHARHDAAHGVPEGEGVGRGEGEGWRAHNHVKVAHGLQGQQQQQWWCGARRRAWRPRVSAYAQPGGS